MVHEASGIGRLAKGFENGCVQRDPRGLRERGLDGAASQLMAKRQAVGRCDREPCRHQFFRGTRICNIEGIEKHRLGLTGDD